MEVETIAALEDKLNALYKQVGKFYAYVDGSSSSSVDKLYALVEDLERIIGEAIEKQ